MEFRTLDELLSLDDVKRLGITYTTGLTFIDYTLQSQFSKKYQQKEIFEVLRKDLIEKLLSYSPFFECMVSALNKYQIPISAAKREDGSFWFHYSYQNILPFFLIYFINKYKMDADAIMPDFKKAKAEEKKLEGEKVREEKAHEEIKECFLNVFRKTNEALHKVSPSRQDEVVQDRNFAKFLYRNTDELIELLKQPLTLPILEDIDKDRFLLALSTQALNNLTQMDQGEMPKSLQVYELSMGYLDRYFTIVNYLSEKAGEPYNFSFASFGEFHSYQGLADRYQQYAKKYPETINEYHQELDMGQIFREYLKDARTKIKKDEFVKAIKLRFELFPKGESSEKVFCGSSRKSVISEDIKRLLEEKHEELLEEKINFFSSTDYLWTLEEAHTFGGYRGYIYPNGKVIFEKFYRNTRNGLGPTYDESFIAMDLLDFIEIAPKSKTELIDFIRNQKLEYEESVRQAHGLPEGTEVMSVIIKNPKYKDIRRHYHVPGWQQRAQAIIEEEVPEYDFDLIETLLSDISNTPQVDKTYTK